MYTIRICLKGKQNSWKERESELEVTKMKRMYDLSGPYILATLSYSTTVWKYTHCHFAGYPKINLEIEIVFSLTLCRPQEQPSPT